MAFSRRQGGTLMKKISLLLTTVILLAASALAQDNPTCNRCSPNTGCYQIEANGWCGCDWEPYTCSLDGTCYPRPDGTGCQGGDTKAAKFAEGHPWVSSPDLATNVTKEDAVAGQMVASLLRHIARRPEIRGGKQQVYMRSLGEFGDITATYDNRAATLTVYDQNPHGSFVKTLKLGDGTWELRIKNDEGQLLGVHKGEYSR
jgi:hypothetical protein